MYINVKDMFIYSEEPYRNVIAKFNLSEIEMVTMAKENKKNLES